MHIIIDKRVSIEPGGKVKGAMIDVILVIRFILGNNENPEGTGNDNCQLPITHYPPSTGHFSMEETYGNPDR